MNLSEGALERLILNNPEFDDLSAALDVFCPFEAVGMERQEVRHGHFLSYVLDPQRPHGFGAECLRGFMWAAAAALSESGSSTIRPLDVHLMNLDAAIVDREFRSIDLLIQVPSAKIALAVELKIDASEHSGQLGRYRTIIAKEFPVGEGWRHVLLFLTKRGEAPSEEDGEDWLSLPLERVADAFEHVVDRGNGHREAQVILGAYVNMLRRKHLTDARMENLARSLWREHRDALEFLMERRPDAASEIFGILLDRQKKVAERLSAETGMEIESEHSTRTYVRFGVKDWDALPGMLTGTGWKPSKRMFLFELSRMANGGIRCCFVLGPGASPNRELLFDAFRADAADVGGTWDLAPKWRQMGTKVLMKASESEGIDEQFEAVVAGCVGVLRQHLPKYNATIQRLLNSSGA